MKNLKIAHQLLILVSGLMLAFAGVTYIQLLNSADAIKHERFDLLRTQVESAISILDGFHKRELAGEMSREEAQTAAYRVVSQIKFEPAGYFFGSDYNVIQRFHPSPANVGKDTSTMSDKNGMHFSVDFVQKGRAGGGITTYFWAKPGAPADEVFEKATFSKAFEPWQIVVTTGVYMDDVDAQIAKAAWNAIAWSAEFSRSSRPSTS